MTVSGTTHVARCTIRTDRSVLEVDVVRLEVDISKQGLQGSPRRSRTDQGCVERRRYKQDGGLGVVDSVLDEGVVPDVNKVASGCVAR